VTRSATTQSRSDFSGVVPLVIVVVLTCVCIVLAAEARWSELDCAGSTCTYESRRLLTFPFPVRGSVPRHELATKPHAISLDVLDPNRRTSEVRAHPGTLTIVVFQGTESEARAKQAALLRDLSDPSALIHESSTPHPFGFVVLAVASVCWLIASAASIAALARRRRN